MVYQQYALHRQNQNLILASQSSTKSEKTCDNQFIPHTFSNHGHICVYQKMRIWCKDHKPSHILCHVRHCVHMHKHTPCFTNWFTRQDGRLSLIYSSTRLCTNKVTLHRRGSLTFLFCFFASIFENWTTINTSNFLKWEMMQCAKMPWVWKNKVLRIEVELADKYLGFRYIMS